MNNQQRNDPVALALKLFLKILMGILFAFVLNLFFVSAIENKKTVMLVIMQIVELLICGGLVYGNMWNAGNRDLNKVRFNREKRDFFKGLKIGLIATIPNFVVFVLVIIAKLAGWTNWVFAIYKLMGAYYVPIVYKYVLTDNILSEISMLRIVLSGCLMLFVPLVATGAYMLGISDYSLLEHTLYKKQELNR